jgi:heme-degrading monooxygenase HmoA
MICRMWHGWTALDKANAYEHYLRNELFPRVKSELGQRGYLGFHILRTNKERETEFVTLVWFESLESVKSFAGEKYETPVISDKAKGLLSRYDLQVVHYDLTGSSWAEFQRS